MSWRSEPDGTAVLFDERGRRKYLTASERSRFLAASIGLDLKAATFAQLLTYSGCRVSEALELTPARLDQASGRVVFRTLKRRRLVFRAVPVPEALMGDLLNLCRGKRDDEPLWTWSRQTAWRRVKAVMARSGITGAHAMPKGLRHGFGIANAEFNVPVGVTQRWMGHARIETTAIYQNAVGEEERSFAKRLWARPDTAPTKG